MRMLLIIVILIPFIGFSQDQKVGSLRSENDGTSIPQAHVQNLTQSKFTVSNDQGRFMLPMQEGDSIWISCIGYKSIGYVIGKEWSQKDSIVFHMIEDTIMLRSLTINELPSEKQFKQQILKYTPEDTSFVVFGLPENFRKEYDFDANPSLNPRITAGTPFGLIYKSISKKEKEKRKMAKILLSSDTQYTARQKFNREFIASITALKGDELTDFIEFCDFSDEFIVNCSEHQLAQAITTKFEKFKKSLEGC